MVRMIFAAVPTIAAILVFGLQPAAAYEAPWCAVISMGAGDVHWDCQYRSIDECRPNVLAGNRGFCNPNPYFVAAPAEQRRSGKRRARPQ
jgi:uncharacterized protein DUF3551